MEYELVKIEELSGNMSSVYTIQMFEEQETLFDKFLNENKNSFINEIKNIAQRLKVIGNETGAREHFFKLKEGKPGDGVCALYDSPDKHLRLYCIRYGTVIVIIGGGGEKPKNIKTLQENKKLTNENYFLRQVSEHIKQKMKDKEIKFSDDNLEFIGDLTFNTEDYE